MKVCLRGYFTQASLVFWGPKSAWEHLDTITQVKSHIKRKRTFLKRCFQLLGFFSAHIREKGGKKKKRGRDCHNFHHWTDHLEKQWGKQASTYAVFSRSNSAVNQTLKVRFTQKCWFANYPPLIATGGKSSLTWKQSNTQCFHRSSVYLKMFLKLSDIFAVL